MSDTAIEYDSRVAAIDAAEMAGFDRSSVVIRVDAESGLYGWDLRTFEVECRMPDARDAEAASGDGVDAGVDGSAMVVADMVAGLIGEVAGDTDGGLPVVAHVSADVADAFGLEGLIAAGLVVVDLASGAAEVAALLGNDADAGQGAPLAPVVTASPAGMAGDVILQIHGALPAMAARQIAERLAKSLTCLVTMRDAVTFEVIDHVTTASGGTKRVAASSAPTAVRAPREPAIHVETVLDRIKRGQWLDSEVPDSNLTILNLKHRIENAARSGDLDALQALGGFKSTSTYYNHARAYLDFHLVDAPKRQAALDAEFTYGRIG